MNPCSSYFSLMLIITEDWKWVVSVSHALATLEKGKTHEGYLSTEEVGKMGRQPWLVMLLTAEIKGMHVFGGKSKKGGTNGQFRQSGPLKKGIW